jgi:hypothetical protein
LLAQCIVERFPRKQAPVEHHFAIVRTDVVADPAGYAGDCQAGVANEGMVLGPELAVVLVEQGHQMASGEDRVYAELWAAGMRRPALGADERPQAALVRGADRVVRRLADDDQIRFFRAS